jgi:transposase
MKRREVQVLRKAGVTLERTARVAGVSKRSVQRIVLEPTVEEILEVNLAREGGVGRPSVTEPFRDPVRAILAGEPELPTLEVLHRMRQRGYLGGKSALYALVAKLRPPSQRPMVRFEGLPGEFSQHDFGEVVVRYLDGSREKLRFFVSRLKYSRWAHVELVPDEKVESLVRALLRGFESFGGVPLLAVFDNPKTVVLRHLGERTEWNPTFGQVALDYGFGVELCSPRRGNQKGSAENLVGWAKGSFFKVRLFHDRDDVLTQLPEWLHEGNERRPSRATEETPLARMAAERERLRPLAVAPGDYALRFPVVVGPTGFVEHDGIRYAMPPEAIGIPGTLHLYPDRVRIVAGRHTAQHSRTPEVGNTSCLPEHRAALLAKISGERGRLYFKRQQLLDLGDDALTFLTEIVHRHRYTWKGQVEKLFDLLQEHGPGRMVEAFRSAVSERLYGAHYVESLLARGAA